MCVIILLGEVMTYIHTFIKVMIETIITKLSQATLHNWVCIPVFNYVFCTKFVDNDQIYGSNMEFLWLVFEGSRVIAEIRKLSDNFKLDYWYDCRIYYSVCCYILDKMIWIPICFITVSNHLHQYMNKIQLTSIIMIKTLL